jgi:hypothetical protein
MSLSARIDAVRREAPARGLLVVPSRSVSWADLAAMGDLGRLVCLADPTFPLARELGLLGFAGCPLARRPGHKIDGRYQLTLWVMGERAVCAGCGYTETLDALHARLELPMRPGGRGDA